MLFEGQAGRILQKASGILSASLTSLGSLRVAQSEHARDEHTRAGLRFFVGCNGATGIAPVQAVPTTTAQWYLHNPIASLTSAFVDQVGMTLISGTAGAGGTLFACIVSGGNIPGTVPTANAAAIVMSNGNANSGKSPKLIAASNQTLVNVLASNWFPIAQMNANAGTILGQTQIMTGPDFEGTIMLPPGTGLGLAVISPTGTSPLWGPFARWREMASDPET